MMRRSARAGLVLTLLTTSLLIPAAPAVAAQVFADGFETGDTSAWSASSGLTVQSAVVNSGSFAARNTTAVAWAYRTLPLTQTELYARAFVNVLSPSDTFHALHFQTAGGADIFGVFIVNNGRLRTKNYAGAGATTSATTIHPGWNEIQARVLVAGGSSQVQVWLDGTEVTDLASSASLGTDPVGRVEIGNRVSTRTHDVAYDDVVADTAFIGSEPPPPPPPTEPPAAPTGLQATSVTSSRVDLSWDASTGATGYTVYRDGTVLDTTGTTSFSDTTVDPDTTYQYWVDAFNDAGSSPQSSPITVQTPASGGGGGGSRTDVVVILADDMRWDEAGVPTALNETFPSNYLPTIRSQLIAKGFTASNAFVATSLCCPSRAQILTGNYAHTTGVWNNVSSPGTGGFAAFRPHEGSTLATWFDQAGYRTALVGKYLNGYTSQMASHVPAGWDRWVAFAADTIGYYDYKLTIDGTLRSYGSGAADYSTDVLADFATQFVTSTPSAQPLFLMFDPYSPHAPFTPAPRHDGMFASYQPAMPPNVAEEDVSDKPSWVRELAKRGAGWYTTKRKQMEMLMAVDDAVARILGALRDTGRLDDTILVLMSDNGLSGGSHRWTSKKSAWDEAHRVPLIVRGPGIPAGTSGEQLIANIDIAETLGELAGIAVPQTDGVSAASILRGGTAPVRTQIGIERLQDPTNPPSYCGLRTPIYKYIRYATGEEELYDLRVDPWEMQSLHADAAYATVKADLLARTRQLCSPPPPGYSF